MNKNLPLNSISMFLLTDTLKLLHSGSLIKHQLPGLYLLFYGNAVNDIFGEQI